METILAQPALRYIPRVISNQRSLECPLKTPTLLVMDMRPYHGKPIPLELYRALWNVSMFIEALVFVSPESNEETVRIVRPFNVVKWHRILFVCTNFYLNYHLNSNYGELVEIKRFPTSLEAVFPDHLRNMRGYEVRVSHERSNYNAAFTADGSSIGPAIDWVYITAEYINATVTVTRVPRCYDLEDCLRKRFIIDKNRTFDLNIDTDILHAYSESQLSTAVPAVYGVIAPRGRKLDIHELFAEPFHREVWIVILVILVTSYLINRLFPTLFHNELILLIICSFEKTALNRVGRLEKIVAISLTIFFFVLLSAYESLFISLLTNVPREHTPRTLADLSKAGIKIAVNPVTNTILPDEIQPLLVNISSAISDHLDGGYAYHGIRQHLEMIMKHPRNYDSKLGQSRYVLIENLRWMIPSAYMFRSRNPLIRKFRYTQNVMHESGIFRRCSDRLEHAYYGVRAHQIRIRNQGATTLTLDLAQLRPAWMILVIGLSLSGLVWLVDWAWFVVMKIYKRKRDQNLRSVRAVVKTGK